MQKAQGPGLCKLPKPPAKSLFKQRSGLHSPALAGKERLVIALWCRSFSCGDEHTFMGLSGEKREAAEFPRLRLDPSQPWGVVLALGVALPKRSPAPQEHPGAELFVRQRERPGLHSPQNAYEKSGILWRWEGPLGTPLGLF